MYTNSITDYQYILRKQFNIQIVMLKQFLLGKISQTPAIRIGAIARQKEDRLELKVIHVIKDIIQMKVILKAVARDIQKEKIRVIV